MQKPWVHLIAIFIQSLLYGGASQVVLVLKNPPANAGDIRDASSTPGLGRCPGEGNGNPLQSWTRLRDPARMHSFTEEETEAQNGE